jgi:hypothetical protein
MVPQITPTRHTKISPRPKRAWGSALLLVLVTHAVQQETYRNDHGDRVRCRPRRDRPELRCGYGAVTEAPKPATSANRVATSPPAWQLAPTPTVRSFQPLRGLQVRRWAGSQAGSQTQTRTGAGPTPGGRTGSETAARRTDLHRSGQLGEIYRSKGVVPAAKATVPRSDGENPNEQRRRQLGKQVGFTPSRVRIPHLPPSASSATPVKENRLSVWLDLLSSMGSGWGGRWRKKLCRPIV